MFDKLTDKQIETLLERELIGRIGCHSNGRTYVVPISYVYSDGYVYAHSFEGMKLQMMRKNPELCFQVDNTDDLGNWESVIGWGQFEELQSTAERQQALEKLGRRKLPLLSSETMHLSASWPFSADSAVEIEGVFFRIKLLEKTGRCEKRNTDYFFAT